MRIGTSLSALTVVIYGVLLGQSAVAEATARLRIRTIPGTVPCGYLSRR
jgi:hypothetical protein